jgi:o-succinylbenzoate---CoA ligase
MFQLHFENQVYSQVSDWEEKISLFPPFIQAALTFCSSWQKGKNEFDQSTSGSTGVPKPIRITRSQMEASAKATGAFFQVNEKTKMLCCLSPEYIAGKMMLVRAMVWGCPIWLVNPSADPLEYTDQEFDLVAMVPLQVEGSLSKPSSLNKLKKIKNLLIGGAALSQKLKSEILLHQLNAWQSFGMTETVSHVALAKIEAGEMYYQTLPGVEIGQDNRGALWIKSEMGGPNPIQTNDLVDLRSKSSFLWLGRADFVVNSGGIKLFPESLESRSEEIIREFFPGARFFYYGKSDEKLGEKLVLILECPENPLKKNQLLEKLERNLGKYEFPKEVYFSCGFEMTTSGKINRSLTFNNL